MAGASDLAYALDPARFGRACGYDLDDWQLDLMRTPSRRVLICAGRQVGKSLATALMVAHEALFQPGSLSLVVAPAERQSKETFSKIVAAYAALGRPVPAETETALTLRLQNESRIVALPGGSERTIRGYSGADTVVLDEAAGIDDRLLYAVKPMVAASGGRVIMLSSPRGKRGVFYESWVDQEADWLRVEVPATRCSRISPEFLAEEQRALLPWVYESEYLCRFVDDGAQVFGTEYIEQARREDILPLFSTLPGGGPVGTEGLNGHALVR